MKKALSQNKVESLLRSENETLPKIYRKFLSDLWETHLMGSPQYGDRMIRADLVEFLKQSKAIIKNLTSSQIAQHVDSIA